MPSRSRRNSACATSRFCLDLSVSALSHQLRLLRERGVVTRRKVGRIAFYSLADEHVRHVLTDALAHTAESQVEASRTA